MGKGTEQIGKIGNLKIRESNPTTPVVTLYVSGLNTSVKRQKVKVDVFKKARPNNMFSIGNTLNKCEERG